MGKRAQAVAGRDGGSANRTWWWFLVLPLLVPAIIAVVLYGLVPSTKKARARTPRDVAKFLRNFIAGTGGEWDWDDFTSVPISDPALDDIRREADAVPLPVDAEGLAKLRELLDRVNSLPC